MEESDKADCAASWIFCVGSKEGLGHPLRRLMRAGDFALMSEVDINSGLSVGMVASALGVP